MIGEKIKNEWERLPERFPNVELDVFVVMPNHFHTILTIGNSTCRGAPCGYPLRVGASQQTGQPQGIAPTGKTIGDMIEVFKSLTTNEYICGVKSGKFPPFEKRIWQRNYHEHIIRNQQSYEKIHDYITCNPENWGEDKFFVE